MRKMLVLFIAVALALSIGLEAKAQQRAGDGFNLTRVLRPPTTAEMQALAQDLQLSEEQRAEMQRQYSQYRGQLQQLRGDYQKAQRNLAVAFKKEGAPDPGRVEDALRELHRFHRSIVDTEMQLWNALSNNLTQEQTEQFWTHFANSRLRNTRIERDQEFEWYPEEQ